MSAVSTEGVRMFLSDGSGGVPLTITGISKAKPAQVTGTVNAAGLPPAPVPITAITPGATTTFTTDAASFAKMAAGPSVTFAGFTGGWAGLNGAHAATQGTPGSNEFTIAVDSSGFGATPAVGGISATLPATAPTIAASNLVVLQDTGFPELDGKVFPVSVVGVGTFDLMGTDLTKSTGTFKAGATGVVYTGAELITLCLSDLAISPTTPGTRSVGTYCEPAASVPAAVTDSGTATLTGYADRNDSGYLALLNAADDKKRRVLSILSPDNGEWVAPLQISAISWAFPREGDYEFTATAALNAPMRHVF